MKNLSKRLFTGIFIAILGLIVSRAELEMHTRKFIIQKRMNQYASKAEPVYGLKPIPEPNPLPGPIAGPRVPYDIVLPLKTITKFNDICITNTVTDLVTTTLPGKKVTTTKTKKIKGIRTVIDIETDVSTATSISISETTKTDTETTTEISTTVETTISTTVSTEISTTSETSISTTVSTEISVTTETSLSTSTTVETTTEISISKITDTTTLPEKTPQQRTRIINRIIQKKPSFLKDSDILAFYQPEILASKNSSEAPFPYALITVPSSTEDMDTTIKWTSAKSGQCWISYLSTKEIYFRMYTHLIDPATCLLMTTQRILSKIDHFYITQKEQIFVGPNSSSIVHSITSSHKRSIKNIDELCWLPSFKENL
ncbi:hypothetical protein BB558_002814 [Smittium angustum]|uniref:Uncharacterized protein n=1 Tax=Smittium angustum TaxID=133377 RepID=A0A2U1J7P1_SMIAN|nr:hypothetical protein BB558_002814 [Smittium angustum]